MNILPKSPYVPPVSLNLTPFSISPEAPSFFTNLTSYFATSSTAMLTTYVPSIFSNVAAPFISPVVVKCGFPSLSAVTLNLTVLSFRT